MMAIKLSESAAEPAASVVVLGRGQRSTLSTVLSGGSWGLFSQFVPLTINLVLTPYVIAGFGLSRYGLYMLTTTIISFIGTFDGGLGATAARFLAVLAGRDDRIATTRLLVTVSTVIMSLAFVASAGLWFLIPSITHLFHMPAHLRPEAIFLFRATIFLFGLGTTRSVLNSAIFARGRFAFVSLIDTSLYGVYVVGIVLSVAEHWGLRGVAVTFIVMQLLSVILILPVLRGYVTRRGLSFMSRQERRQFFSYASRVQLVSIAALVNNEVDSLIIAVLLPVRQVALFQAGGSFSFQIRNMLSNGLAPMPVVLGNTLGREGRAGVDRRFARLQRRWVQVTVGWSAAGAGAIWFGITSWLGPRFGVSGVVALVFMVGGGVNLLTGVMVPYLAVIGRPGLEARFAICAMLVNIALTIPLAFTGIVGIAAGTAAGGAVSAFYLMWLVRRELGTDVPSFLHDLPWAPAALTLLTCVGLELALRPIVPRGALGLLICAVPAGVSLLLYAALVAGTRRTAQVLRHPRAVLRDPRALITS